jgi:hypothetical protein
VLEPPAFPQIRQQAQAAVDAGDRDGARALLEGAVAGGRSRLAGGDPELLETMRQLAGLHTRAGDPQAARRILEEAVAAAHRMADPDPLAVMLAHDLGAAAEQLANRHEARVQFTRVAEFGPEALGAEHWAVARARSYLDTGESVPAEPAVTAPVFTAASFAEPPPPPPAPAPPSGPIPPLPGQPAAPFAPAPIAPAPFAAEPPPSASAEPVLPFSAASVSPFAAGPASPSSAGPASPSSGGLVPPSSGGLVPPSSGGPVPPSSGGVVPPFAAVPVPPFSGGPGSGSAQHPTRKPWAWILAGTAVVVVAALVVVLVRPGGEEEPASLVLPSLPAGATTPAATRGLGAAPTPSSVPSSSAPSSAAAEPAGAAAGAAATGAAAAPSSRPATVRTRIVSPAGGSSVRWPFDAAFSVSAADVAAADTVVALSICVAGLCYLDGRLDIIEGRAAPYTVYLGSTKPEGTGVPWTLRLDRLSKSAYAALVADRDAAIGKGTWGVTDSTPVGSLNATPVSTLTVTKKPG